MNAESRQRVKEIFQAASERDPGDRQAFVDGVCGSDAELRAEVLSLLAHAEEDSFLERPPVEQLAEALSSSMVDRIIGPFRVVREIDFGGMGEVYEVREETSLRRTVALKLIRRDLTTDKTSARFEVERLTLALMNHPNIAQIYAAGTTDDGRPYFAMELVPGKPITVYCEEQRSSVADRLRLFNQVCSGIQHAHQKGIIHRDLKPSNVLVTIQDGMGVPKIIDFGIAKIVGEAGETEADHPIGTRAYMSPEHRRGIDADTRTDVYSLGLILYELLVGELPAQCSGEPLRPSALVGRLGDRGASIAKSRRTDSSALARELRGDLDWIVLRALEEDRDRRYSSVSELAIDIRRHLENEPVLASPPSARYRIGKFLRRNKAGVAAGTVAILALVIGTIGTSVGLVRARKAEVVARQEASRATREAETARQVSDFLVGLFQVSDPDESKGNTVTARELLDAGSRKITVELKEQPEVRASLMEMIGRVYQSLGIFDSAEDVLRKALTLKQQRPGNGPSDLASSQYHLAEVLLDRAQYTEAEILYRKALGLRRRSLGPRHPDVAESLIGMGHVYLKQGKDNNAESCFLQALGIWESVNDPRVATALSYLAVLYRDQGKYDRAIPLFERSIKIQERKLGPVHTDLDANLNNLADIYRAVGRYRKAEILLKRILAENEKIVGPEHPIVATIVNNLGMVYRMQNRFTEAEVLYKRSLAADLKAKGPDHPDVATSLNNLAIVYREQGKFRLAEPIFLRSLAIRENVLGPKHPHVAGSLNNLGLLYSAEGRLADAERLFKRALAIREEVLGLEHPHTAISLTNLANLYRKKGDLAQAAPLLHEAMEIWKKLPEPSKADLATTLESLADILQRTGRHDEAKELETRARQIRNQLAAESNA